MEKDMDIEELGSPQLIPGRKKPPAPWDDRKGTGMTVGELLTERIGNLIGDRPK